MCQQHPQCNLLILFHQGSILLQHLRSLQLWHKSLCLVSVIKVQLPLLYKLHACQTCNHFCARCDPEDAIQCHVFGACHAAFTCGMCKELGAIFGDDYNTGPRNGGFWVGAGRLDGLFEVIGNVGR